MGFHQFPHYSSFSVPGFNPRNHTAFSQSVSLNSVEIFKERVHLNCVIYKVLHIGEVFGYPLLNSWKRAGGIQETPACVSRLSVASFKFAKHFFFFTDISIHHPKQPMTEARQMAFCFFPLHWWKKLKPRDSKTHVVTQGLVFRRALCLVSYSVATFLKVLGYESGALHFHFVLGPRMMKAVLLGVLALLTHTGR